MALLCIVLSGTYLVKADDTGNVTSGIFKFRRNNADIINDGTMFEIQAKTTQLQVISDTGIKTSDKIVWTTSDASVISFGYDSSGNPISTKTEETGTKGFIDLTRNGPGYATITAIITRDGYQYSVACLAKVDLKIKDGPEYTNTKEIDTTGTRAIKLTYNPATGAAGKQQVYLQYTNNDDLSNTLVSWEVVSLTEGKLSDDIAKVDNGLITAVGAGTVKVKLYTNTIDKENKPITVELLVIVEPMVNLNITNTGNANWSSSGTIDNAPSTFSLQSNAQKATNLTWKVLDSNRKVIPATGSSLLSYEVSTLSGNLNVKNAKAGTYYIQAFASDKFNTGTAVQYVEITVNVPLVLDNYTVVMNVGDTYNIVDASNVPSYGMFSSVNIAEGSYYINLNQTTGTITGKNKGTAKIVLNYKETVGNVVVDKSITLTIIVIDAISLDTSYAVIYTKGTLQLQATVSDPTVEILWESSDKSIATVENGLVTGVKPGTVTITAKQIINGVTKSATCEILVQQSVENITIDPSQYTLEIGGYVNLNAKIKPANLQGVSLKWISSDEKVVSIIEAGKTYATVQGVSGGTAIITAINQDNVVVGFSKITVNQPVTSIVLSESNITVDLAQKTVQLRATVYPINATNKEVKWTSTDPKVVKVDANTGLVTLVKAGTASIIATSVDNPSVTAICNVTVTTPVTGIVLEKTVLSMVVGETYKLSYTVTPTSATNTAVTWSSTNTSVINVDATGRLTAKGVGQAVIIVKTLNGNYIQTCTVTVTRNATNIKLNVNSLVLSTGQTYELDATLNPADSTDVLIWESSDSKIATVSNSGKVTAKKAGNTVIMVKTAKGLTAYCSITVVQAATGVELNYSKATVVVGNKLELEAVVLPKTATNTNVTYKTSDQKIATVTKNGLVRGVKGGTVIITVTTEDGGYEAICLVTVKELVTSITIEPSYILGRGDTYKLRAIVETNSATDPKLKWKSSNPDVVTVDSKGKIKGISNGKATITVKAKDGSGAEATCEVRVVKEVTSISLNKTSITIVEGNTYKLKATIRPTNATFKKAKWRSSDKSVAIVDNSGLITALKPGTTIIKVAAKDNSGKTATCYVNVIKKVPATSITVADQELILIPGESKTVNAVMNPAATTDSYSWSSDNTAVATVNKTNGRIEAKSVGTAVITVMTKSGKTARITVYVVGLNRSSLTLEQYSSYSLRVEGNLTGVRWDVENPSIATVTSNGLVQTRAVGTTNIVATVNGRRIACRLTVTKIRS